MRIRAAAGAFALGLTIALAAASPQPVQGGAEPPPYFGFNEDWGDHDNLALAAAGGADVSRAVISWRAVEPRREELSWERYDRLYASMLEAGTRPLWVLADAPCWAWSPRIARCQRRNVLGRAPQRRHDDEWGAFAAAVVERYPETAAIETWNEPNLVDFWKPRPRPRRAAAMTAAANLAVDAVDPEVPVVLGGLAPLYETIPEKREIAYDEFLREVYAEAGRGAWDAVAIHPFPRFRAGPRYLEDIREHLHAVREALADARARGTPIWVTEIGLSTAGPFPYTAQEQADGLVRIYKRLARMPDVPAVIVHRLIDLGPDERAEAGWGVVREDGEQKPAYCALARVRGRKCPADEPLPIEPPTP